MPYTIDRNLGWNSGARSRKVCFGDCQLRFSIPVGNTGACVGINTSDKNADFREITHALLFQATTSGPRVFVYESGVEKFSAGEYESADIFTIRRNGTTIRYYKNSELLYTSAVSSTGGVFVDTSLYAGGDSV